VAGAEHGSDVCEISALVPCHLAFHRCGFRVHELMIWLRPPCYASSVET
jgi:hypothetical protein